MFANSGMVQIDWLVGGAGLFLQPGVPAQYYYTTVEGRRNKLKVLF